MQEEEDRAFLQKIRGRWLSLSVSSSMQYWLGGTVRQVASYLGSPLGGQGGWHQTHARQQGQSPQQWSAPAWQMPRCKSVGHPGACQQKNDRVSAMSRLMMLGHCLL